MRWLTTLLLAALVVAGGFWLWKGDELAPKVGLTPAKPDAVAASPAVDALKELTPETVRSVSVFLPPADCGKPKEEPDLTLTRGPDGTWTQPGNWPVRQAEAAALVESITKLAPRYQPTPIEPGEDLGKYGLTCAHKPVTVKVEAAGRTRTLLFGRPPAKPDESAFEQPTYVRVDGMPELVRLGSGLLAKLNRPADEFRRKQLFPDAQRVKLVGGEPAPNPLNPAPPPGPGPVPLLGDRYTAVTADGPDGGWTLKRVAKTPEPKTDADRPFADPSLSANKLATAWEVVAATDAAKQAKPLRDKVDPAKLRAVLTGIPDVWAAGFVTDAKPEVTGLSKPERSLTVIATDGSSVVLRIGNVSRSSTKTDAPAAPNPFSPAPPPKTTTEEYRYAKLDNNPLVFEVRTDRLADLFPKADDLRDAQLARFDTADVLEIKVEVPGKPPVTVTKKKGNKDAEKDEDKQDRWYVGEVLAEASKVTELLDQLGRLEAKNAPSVTAQPPGTPLPPPAESPILDNPDAKTLADLGLIGTPTRVTLKTADGSTSFLFGKPDADKKKVPVQVAGWPRVNRLADDILKSVDRPALAYRGRRLFDTAEAKLTGVAVTKDGEAFALAQANDKWKLTKPVALEADEAKVSTVTGDLSRLEVTEYVDDAPKPEDLDKKYGLAKPKLAIDLTFSAGKPRKLEVGGSPEFKSEYYARLDGTGSVFTLPKDKIDAAAAGAVAFLSPALWTVSPDKVTAVEVTRPDGAYKLASAAGQWKLTGPFEANVPYPSARPLLAAVASVRAEKYESLTADPAKHGFDKPALKLTVTYTEPKADDPKQEVPVTRTLLVGKPTADGATSRFAKIDGGPNPAVFTVPDALVKDADKPALDLLDRTLLLEDPAKLTKVMAGDLTLTKDAKGTWAAGGLPLDKPTLDALTDVLARPAVERIAAYGPAVKWADYGLDQPAFTVAGTFGTALHTIKLGKVSPTGGRFARVDDGPAAAVLTPAASEALARGRLDFVDRTLLNFDPAALTGFTRRDASDSELDIVPAAAAGWEISGKTKLKADQPIMDELADQLSKLRAVRVAEYPAKALAKFGLSEPAAAVTLTVGTEAKTLLVGGPVDPAKPDGERYAMTETKGDTAVGVLPAALANRLLAPPLKFRNRLLAEFRGDPDKAVLQRGDRTATFARVDGTWKLVSPVQSEAEQADLDELVNALAKLRADDWAAEKPADLGAFGLAKPEAVWTLSAGGQPKLTLHVGKSENGRVFAKLSNGDLVAVLDPGLTGKVLGEYRRRSVWTGVDASQVDAVAVTGAGGGFGFVKFGTVWADKADAKAVVDQPKVSELLDALAGLKAERYVADANADLKLYGLQPPERVIVLTTKSGIKTLHLGRAEGGVAGNGVYARVDETGRSDVFLLSKADTAKLLRDRPGYARK